MQKQRWSAVVLGASGRVGRLILAEWGVNPPPGLQIKAQRRQGHPPDIIWDLAAGADALAAAIAQTDVMVVLSGITPSPGAAYGLNSDLALAAVKAAAVAGVRHLFIASSAAVYGRSDSAIGEDAPLAPITDYGQAKLAMERACTDWLERSPLPRPGVTFLRIGNVAGTDLFFRNLALASPEAPLRLDQFRDGSGPVRSYIGPGSLARVLACLIHRAVQGKPLPMALNVGASSLGVDMADFAPALLAQGYPAPVVRIPAPETALPSVRLSVDLLAGLCPLSPDEQTAAAMVQQWLALKGAA